MYSYDLSTLGLRTNRPYSLRLEQFPGCHFSAPPNSGSTLFYRLTCEIYLRPYNSQMPKRISWQDLPSASLITAKCYCRREGLQRATLSYINAHQIKICVASETDLFHCLSWSPPPYSSNNPPTSPYLGMHSSRWQALDEEAAWLRLSRLTQRRCP